MSLITRLSLLAGLIGALLMAATGAMLTYEVVARYFFIKPTIWAAELSQLCLIWGCLLAMAQVLTLRRHITVNALTALLPRGAQIACAAVSLILVIVVSGIIGYWGWDIFYDSFVRGRTTGSLLNMPVWVVELAVPVGFALLALQAIVELAGLSKARDVGLGSAQE